MPTYPEGDDPFILLIICDTVSTHLTPTSTNIDAQSPDKPRGLVKAVLGFLDAVLWSLPSESEDQYVPAPASLPSHRRDSGLMESTLESTRRLSAVIRAPKFLSTLLDPTQPTWFLEQSTRLIALLATRTYQSFPPTLEPQFHGSPGTSLYTDLLALPDDVQQQSNQRSKGENSQLGGGRQRLPQMENLCTLLMDTKRIGSEVRSSSIL